MSGIGPTMGQLKIKMQDCKMLHQKAETKTWDQTIMESQGSNTRHIVDTHMHGHI